MATMLIMRMMKMATTIIVREILMIVILIIKYYQSEKLTAAKQWRKFCSLQFRSELYYTDIRTHKRRCNFGEAALPAGV